MTTCTLCGLEPMECEHAPVEFFGEPTAPPPTLEAEHCFKCNRHQSKCICSSDRPDARQAECECGKSFEFHYNAETGQTYPAGKNCTGYRPKEQEEQDGESD
jgi:hypothetical protein